MGAAGGAADAAGSAADAAGGAGDAAGCAAGGAAGAVGVSEASGGMSAFCLFAPRGCSKCTTSWPPCCCACCCCCCMNWENIIICCIQPLGSLGTAEAAGTTACATVEGLIVLLDFRSAGARCCNTIVSSSSTGSSSL